jgi:DNA-binding transcriptional LysR family regulator
MYGLSKFRDLAFDFKMLDIFAVVYQCSSMTVAARQLEMTQSAVSQAISRLENGLGISLFHRSRPLVPTPAADTFFELAGQLLVSAEQMEEKVQGNAGSGRAVVRVGMVDSFAATIGPKLIPRLRSKAEQLSVWSGISRNLETELLNGKLDMLVGSQPLAQEKGITAYPLLREPYFIVLPERMAKTMMKTGEDVRLRDLVLNHTFVRYSLRSKIGVDIEKYLEQSGYIPPQSLEFDGTEAAFAMVNGGLGWMISTPLCLIHGTNVESGLTAVPLPAPGFERNLYLLARNNIAKDIIGETLAEAKEITRQLMKQRLGELAPWSRKMVRLG